MKIVVTGAAGFIGSHLCERLALVGHQVVGIDSLDDFLYPANIKRRNARQVVESTAGSGFCLYDANICDGDAIGDILDESIDLVCHLAALPGVRPSLGDPARYMRTNIEGTVQVLEACQKASIDKLIFASSSSVYGTRSGSASFLEMDPCLQQASPYAASKRFAELLCSTYRDLYGLGIVCLRLFTVYGPRQRPDMAIYKFVHAITAGEPITLFGDGHSSRDYSYIDDIVDGFVSTIRSIEPDRFEVFNLGSSTGTELIDLVSIIEEVVGKKAIIDRVADQTGDVPRTLADTSLAKIALGYQPKIQIREGIERYWQYCQYESKFQHPRMSFQFW